MATLDARMATMETQMDAVKSDVAEIKSTVNILAAGQTEILKTLAVNAARNEQLEKGRASTGTWLKWAMPFLITLILFLITIHSYLDAT